MSSKECRSYAPIHWEFNPYNWFLVMFSGLQEHKELFPKFIDSLKQDPPALMSGGGGQWVGLVPFDWGFHGVIKGTSGNAIHDIPLGEILGDWTQGLIPISDTNYCFPQTN